jgi:thiamine biosynthesis lipoprotein
MRTSSSTTLVRTARRLARAGEPRGRAAPFAAAAALAAALLAACSPRGQEPADLLSLAGQTMGTTWTVKLPAAGAPDTTVLRGAVEAVLEGVNARMSGFREDSELSRFNRHAGDDWFPVSAATARVLTEAERTSRLSDGAFDVTVWPLVQLWGFGVAGRRDAPPAPEALAAARERVGWRRLAVHAAPPALRKTRPDVQIDLGAIAKGFGVDAVADTLASLGLASYLVEIGGELRAAGAKGPGQPWQVGIERPQEIGRGVQRILALSGMALATSGDYRNYFEEGGRRYSHTIDPRRGEPIAHRLASVTVADPLCMRADALATALMVLGPERGYELALHEELAAYFIVRGEDGFLERATPAFERLALH